MVKKFEKMRGTLTSHLMIKAIPFLALTVALTYFYYVNLSGKTEIGRIYMLLDWGRFALVTGIILFSLWNIKDCMAALQTTAHKNVWLYAAVVSFEFLSAFNPTRAENIQVLEFTRNIGTGILDNWDVSRLISNYYLWFVLFAALLLVTAAFFAYIRNIYIYTQPHNKDRIEAAWAFLDNLIVVACAGLLLKGIQFFSDGIAGYYDSYLIWSVLLASTLYLLLKLYRHISFDSFSLLLVIGLALVYPAMGILSMVGGNARVVLILQMLVLLGVVLAVRVFARQDHCLERKQNGFISGAVLIAAMPLLLFFCIELFNILAARGIFVPNPRVIYLLMVLLTFGTAAAVFFINKKTAMSGLIVYPLFLFGVTALQIQAPLTGVYSADVFESANYSILISEFLNYGKIPLVSHYGGHMMTSVWEGILYGLLNGDVDGASFIVYGNYGVPFITVFFYLILKELWDEKSAFWITLAFPFYDDISYYALGLFVVLALVWFVKKPGYSRAAFLWFAFIWTALYRLDLGASFGAACIITLAIYVICQKQWTAVKPLGITLAVWAIFGCSLWAVLCLIEGANPVTRLIEFLLVSASNQNWAYGTIGNYRTTIFVWCYLILPILATGSLLYLSVSRKTIDKVGVVRWCIVVMLGVAYLANFSRGLTRHSLYEGVMYIAIWCSGLYFAALCSCYAGKKALLPVFAVIILLNHQFLNPDGYYSISLAERSAGSITSSLSVWKNASWQQLRSNGEPVERVIVSPELEAKMQPLQQIADAFLAEDETFLDFANRSFAYTWLGKQNPVYVSQSPLQLSGEYTQELFIKQIKENIDKVPIAILPYDNSDVYAESDLDDIANVLRYYKVSEFIYQNYVPLCSCDAYAVWCLKDRYEELSQRINYLHASVFTPDMGGVYQVHQLDATAENHALQLIATGENPYVEDFQNLLDLTRFEGLDVRLQLSYSTSADGVIQLYYKNAADGSYSDLNSVKREVLQGEGVVSFILPAKNRSFLRLVIPADMQLEILGVTAEWGTKTITYGYDRNLIETADSLHIDEDTSLHQYQLRQLALLWGEYDSEEAWQNPVAAEVSGTGPVYTIVGPEGIDKTNGNYLSVTMTAEKDTAAVVQLGAWEGGKFVEHGRYSMDVAAGRHTYLLRVSCDYGWYSENTNAIYLDATQGLSDIQMCVLEGD